METTAINQLPPVIVAYLRGLATHDLALIASSLAEEVQIILAARTLNKKSFLSYLTALYSAFPDWQYQHGEPLICSDGSISIQFSQGGTHSDTWVLSGSPPVSPTRRTVRIPLQHFVYRAAGDKIIEIRPEPVQGGAPEAVLEQIGVSDFLLG